MSKQKKWTLAVVLLLLAAVGGALAWWYIPRPLMDPAKDYQLHMAMLYHGTEEEDLLPCADPEALLNVLEKYEQVVESTRRGGYLADIYPLELGFAYPGGSWYIIAGPEFVSAYDSGEEIIWHVTDGEKLWQELQVLLPELGA